MKKYIASIGAIATTVAPIIMVVSCAKKPRVKTQAELDVITANAAVTKINKSILNPLVTKTSKASSGKINDAAIKDLSVFSGLSLNQKSLIFIATKADDIKGTLKITISVKGGEATKTVTLSGFLTTGQENIAKVEAIITKVKAGTLSSLTIKTNKASAEKTKITDASLRKLNIFDSLDSSQKSLISVASVAFDDNGTLIITVSVAGGKTKTITLDGFKTIKQENVDKAIKTLDKLTKTTFKDLFILSKKASAEKAKITNTSLRKLNIFDSLDSSQKSLISVASVAFDDNGTLKITVSIAGGKTKIITLDGFKTIKQENIDKAIKTLDKVTKTTFKDLFILSNKASAEKVKITNTSLRKLNIFDILNPAQKSLISVASVAFDDNGTLIIIVSVAGGKTKIITLDGFKTIKQENVDKAIKTLDKVTKTTFKDLFILSNKASAEKVKITDASLRKLNIFDSLDSSQKSLISVASAAFDDNGTLIITVSVAGGKTKTITLDGFKTIKQENLEKVNVALASLKDVQLNKLVNKGNLASNQDTLMKTKIKNLFSLTEVQKELVTITSIANDSERKLVIKISVKDGTSRTFTLTGFREMTNLEKTNAVLTNLKNTELNKLVNKGNLASNQDNLNEAKIKGLDALSSLTNDQKDLIIITSMANDSERKLVITISAKSGISRTFELTGFRKMTSIEKANMALKKITVASLNNTFKGNENIVHDQYASSQYIRFLLTKNIIPQELFKGLLKELTPTQKALIAFKAEGNDETGELEITINVKGGISKTIILSGFKQNSKEDDENNVLKAEKELDSLSKEDFSKILFNKKNYPSVENKRITKVLVRDAMYILGGPRTLINVKSEADDAKGTIKITISIKGSSKTKIITLSGFHAIDEEKINAVLTNLKNTELNPQLNKLVNKGNLASNQDNLTEAKIKGLAALSSLTSEQKDLIIITRMANDSEQKLVITIGTKSGISRTFEITGFRKMTSIEKANEALKKITQVALKNTFKGDEKTVYTQYASSLFAKFLLTRNIIPQQLFKGVLKNLTLVQRELITFKAESNDKKGLLKITISVNGGEHKTITLTGFKKLTKKITKKVKMSDGDKILDALLKQPHLTLLSLLLIAAFG